MAKGRKRRVWTDDEKRMVCAQARLPGVSVSQVARRYDVNANLVFTWLRDPRYAPGESAEGFLPVEVVEDHEWRHPATGPEGRIEIDLARLALLFRSHPVPRIEDLQGITNGSENESKSQENTHQHHAFLQIPLLQISQNAMQINAIGVRHGELIDQ